MVEIRMEWVCLESRRWCVSVSARFGEPHRTPVDGDYTIFQWRQNGNTDPPTVYLRDPSEPLPSQSSYRNPSFYLFHPNHTVSVQSGVQHDSLSVRSKKKHSTLHDGVPKHKREFEDFHTSNGVRTITGGIGPVQNGRRTATSSGIHSQFIRSSTHAAQDWVSLCICVPKVCHEARLHPTRRRARALWI